MGDKCNICGYNKSKNALAFHHVDPSKKDFSISSARASALNWQKTVEEVKKCILVCHNCHSEIHEGITEIPENYTRFNENYVEYRLRDFRQLSCLLCGKSRTKASKKYCSIECFNNSKEKKNRPTKEELQKMLENMPVTHIASEYGVTSNSVAKWCKKFEIETKPRGYWNKVNAGLI